MSLLDGLKAFGEGLAYNSQEQQQDRADQRELDMYEKKQMLVNKMTADLEERKQQLADQYPDLKGAYTTPFGVTFARYGNQVQEVARDEEVRQAFLDNKRAPMARVEQAAPLTEARTDKTQAEARAIPQKTLNDTVRANRASSNSESSSGPKPLTETQRATLYEKAYKKVVASMEGYNDNSKAKALADLPEEERAALISAQIAEMTRDQSSSEGAAPSTPRKNRYVK